MVSWSTRRQFLLVFAIAFIVNANSLTNGWALDDTLLITHNNFTRQGLAGIPDIWSNDVFVGYLGQGGVETGGRYRPLSHTVFAMQYALVGEHPWLGHLTNVLLYALTCALLFKLLARLFPESAGGSFWANVPLLAALLFAVHPVHAEVVANIKSLDEILAMLFALLAALTMGWGNTVHRARSVLLGCTVFFLALTAKENAITFLGVVPLVIWYTGKDAKRTAMGTAFLILPTALYFLLRSVALGRTPQLAWHGDFLTDPFHGATGWEHLATTALILVKNIGLLLFPWPLTTDYYPPMVPVVGWNDPRAILGGLTLVSFLAFGLARARSRDKSALGMLWFVMTYSVVSNVFINLGTPMNDRFLFMPSAGFMLLLAALFVKVMEQWQGFPSRIMRGAVLLVLAAYALLMFSRNRDWRDDLALFAHDVTVSDKSARCHVMYGKLLAEAAASTHDAVLKERQLAEAGHHLERGITIYPDYALAHGLLGKLAMDGKDYPAATDHFIACLRRDSTEAVAVKNLAFIGRRMGEAKEFNGAERAFRAAIRYDPRTMEPYLFLADALMRTGRPDSSLVLLDQVIEQADTPAQSKLKADAFRLKGEAYAVYLKQPLLAEEHLMKAHALKPEDLSVIDNLGVAAFQRGDYPRALSFFLKGSEIAPDDARRLRNIAETYIRIGDDAKAAEFSRRAAEVGARP